LVGERSQFGDAGLDRVEFRGHSLGEVFLDGGALVAVPHVGQGADLVEGQPELLGAGDEGDPLQGALVVEAVPAVAACRGGDEADGLVVAQGRGAQPGAFGDFGDAQVCHPGRVGLRVDWKVKDGGGDRRHTAEA
jgi:hypothetical protein